MYFDNNDVYDLSPRIFCNVAVYGAAVQWRKISVGFEKLVDLIWKLYIIYNHSSPWEPGNSWKNCQQSDGFTEAENPYFVRHKLQLCTQSLHSFDIK